MTPCPSCKSTRTIGTGAMATCAKFIAAQESPADAAFRRLREELTPEQRAAEQAIRLVSFAGPKLLDMERDL